MINDLESDSVGHSELVERCIAVDYDMISAAAQPLMSPEQRAAGAR